MQESELKAIEADCYEGQFISYLRVLRLIAHIREQEKEIERLNAIIKDAYGEVVAQSRGADKFIYGSNVEIVLPATHLRGLLEKAIK